MVLCVALAATSTISLKGRLDPFFDDFCDFDTPFMRIYDELDKIRVQMSHVFDEMEHSFRQGRFGSRFNITMPKNNVQIKEEDDKTTLHIKVGKDVKAFDAKIRTREPYIKDQLIIKIKEPKKQKIAIKANGDIISVYQKVKAVKKTTKKCAKKDIRLRQGGVYPESCRRVGQDEKKDVKEKVVSYGASESSETMRLKHKIDLKKADVEYDKKEGILKVIIPVLQSEKHDKKIEVKIKK